MTSKVTQCPKCSTSFRVTEAQLNIANGAVRCGSCLHIFNAPDHWLDATNTPPTHTVNTNNELDDDKLFEDTGEQRTLNDIFDNDDDLLIEDDFETTFGEIAKQPQADDAFDKEDEEVFDDIAFDKEDEEVFDDIAFGKEDEEVFDDIAFDKEDEEVFDDIAFDDDDQLYGDTDWQHPSAAEEQAIESDDFSLPGDLDLGGSEFSESFLNMDNWEEEPAATYGEYNELDSSQPPKEEEWAQKLLENEESEEELASEPEPFETMPELFDSAEEPERASSAEDELLGILDEEEEEEPALLQPVSEEEFSFAGEALTAGERIGNANNSLLDNIEPEPVVMTARKRRRNWSSYTWMSAIVLAVLALSGQYLFFNFERLARDAQLRPWLASCCQILGCQLPAMDDVRQIQSSNLMVRSHPKIDNALVVDAIITNRANFEQQFPIMELQFTDLSGNIVAGRRFMPNEYLDGELRGVSLMPTRQPIHISLEIVDPGQDAVNYQLYFYPKRDS